MNSESISDDQWKSCSKIMEKMFEYLPASMETYTHPSIEDYALFGGSFKARIEKMLEKRKEKRPSMDLQTFRYKQIEIREGSQTNGFKVLSLLKALCENEALIKAGNCIIITIDSCDELALVAFTDYWVEITTPPLEGADRGYFRKIFDEKLCKKISVKYPQEYAENVVFAIRREFPDNFTGFFQKPVMQIIQPYRHACYGLLFEIAKLEMKGNVNFQRMKEFPVAGIIWLGVFKNLPQKLQSFFGDHHLPVKRWATEYHEQHPHLSYDEVLTAITEEKIGLRAKAAHAIISR